VVDPDRDLGHAAYIGGRFEGYVLIDLADPWAPTEAGRYDYAGRPDYGATPIGEAAFENCHYANYDPDRELACVGDEVGTGRPGGKHVFDIGYGEGSPSNPIPVGFSLSPNAEIQNDLPAERFDWTGHNFNAISKEGATLLASADYHEGAVVYDVTDPDDPTPTDRYRTDDGNTRADTEFAFPGADATRRWPGGRAMTRPATFCSRATLSPASTRLGSVPTVRTGPKTARTAFRDMAKKRGAFLLQAGPKDSQ
jgi:hypothetical protein